MEQFQILPGPFNPPSIGNYSRESRNSREVPFLSIKHRGSPVRMCDILDHAAYWVGPH